MCEIENPNKQFADNTEMQDLRKSKCTNEKKLILVLNDKKKIRLCRMIAYWTTFTIVRMERFSVSICH